ncbi:CopG family ribbon-helix-helix protein [Roseovarius sp. S4756]|uniref:CopG family ribbon-helix-helix protein n=1 Tax=Roseovarius maritimus TaxID=3342637 RepID=UPI0037288922
MASPTSIKLDDDMKARVQCLADARNRTSHWIMREAIAQYVEHKEKREALRRDTLEAWKEFQETGPHTTAEEVDRWLSTWGDEDELPTPEATSHLHPKRGSGLATTEGVPETEERRCGASGR